jgi:S1-C subfamily serine protease
MATIGDGKMVPRTLFANVLVAVQVLFGLVGLALVTGLTFAKFSRPTARVLFSRWAIVTTHDGVPSLMLRMANARGNNIVEAQLHLVLARNETTLEGEPMRRFYDVSQTVHARHRYRPARHRLGRALRRHPHHPARRPPAGGLRPLPRRRAGRSGPARIGRGAARPSIDRRALETRMAGVTRTASAIVLGALLAAPAHHARADDLAVRRALDAASVVIETTGCTGVVGESPQLVLTARHCIEGRQLRVRLSTGAARTAWLVATNEASDQAVLFLEEPAGVEPLELVRRRQIAGTVLYFEGNPRRPRFQSARLDRVGRCPSLPDLPNALFTSIEGVPGDSGAPLVDAASRIVGLVHGGARCHIATPADSLARLVDRVLERGVVELTHHRASAVHFVRPCLQLARD